MEPGAPEKQLVRVVIFQQPYTLRASGDPGETEALAESVDSLMNQISNRSANAEPTRIAVLAALHLADRLAKLQKELAELQARAKEAATKIDELLTATTDEQGS